PLTLVNGLTNQAWPNNFALAAKYSSESAKVRMSRRGAERLTRAASSSGGGSSGKSGSFSRTRTRTAERRSPLTSSPTRSAVTRTALRHSALDHETAACFWKSSASRLLAVYGRSFLIFTASSAAGLLAALALRRAWRG